MPLDLERFLANVNRDGECWRWTARLDPGGYGRYGGRLAHRLAYQLFVGPIPDGLELDHLCRHRWCVNPEHLEPVTKLENHARGRRRTATRCIHGHDLTPANTYIGPNGYRQCRRCIANATARYKRRRATERTFA